MANEYGFHQLVEIPSQAELNDYYANKYYQNDHALYLHKYTDDELKYFKNKIHQKSLIIDQFINPISDKPTLIDFGCGEGFTLSWFSQNGWDVKGIDFSDYGCRKHNPEMLRFFEAGDIYSKLEEIIGKQSKFDCIWLDNVLEHVRDPKSLMEQLIQIAHLGSVLVIEVPNDFSVLQQKLLVEGKIDRAFWIAEPDHISYFNKKGLEQLCETCGWNVAKTIADFPIDFNLANPNANYIMNKETGKGAHAQRIFIENLLHEISPELSNQYYQTLAEMGLGRQIISFLMPK